MCRILEDIQPMVEIGFGKGMQAVKMFVHSHWVAAVVTGIKQDIFPEIKHDGQMLFKIHFHHLREIMPDHRIGFDPLIEPGNQQFNITSVSDIRVHIWLRLEILSGKFPDRQQSRDHHPGQDIDGRKKHPLAAAEKAAEQGAGKAHHR
jgi:hypothetical protein